jgi:glutaminyl-tRNA synthetase
VTHSLCTLEYEDHRPLYDWYLDALGIYHPQQIEFARLNLSHTVMSKRKLLRLVEGGHVSGWDDPRMPTLAGLRRRGYTPESLRDFCDRIGVAKSDNTVELALLEHCVREDLNKRAERRMAVLRPLKLIVENYPEGKVEEMEAVNNPEDPSAGTRKVPFSRELWIEQDDFREFAPKKYFRLTPGAEVRLRYAYIVQCTDFKKNAAGEVIEVRCRYDPATVGGDSKGRSVKGTIHWVSAAHAVDAEVRLYETLFTKPDPDAEEDFTAALNPQSLTVLSGAKVEPALAFAPPGTRFQFERTGYFSVDTRDSAPGRPVFNRTVGLRDTWGKIEKASSEPTPGFLDPARRNVHATLPPSSLRAPRAPSPACRPPLSTVDPSGRGGGPGGPGGLGRPHHARPDLVRPRGSERDDHAIPGLLRAPRRAREAHAGTAARPESRRVVVGLQGSSRLGVRPEKERPLP